jgi:OOP family OmpA-OmpF porin
LKAIGYRGVGDDTDSKGSDAYNQKLSDRRARSVLKWLTSHGIDASRLRAKGHGEERPIDTNETDEGRANNRRVEFHIIEQDKIVEDKVLTEDEAKRANPPDAPKKNE